MLYVVCLNGLDVKTVSNYCLSVGRQAAQSVELYSGAIISDYSFLKMLQ